jgi:hypothetical protein
MRSALYTATSAPIQVPNNGAGAVTYLESLNLGIKPTAATLRLLGQQVACQAASSAAAPDCSHGVGRALDRKLLTLEVLNSSAAASSASSASSAAAQGRGPWTKQGRRALAGAGSLQARPQNATTSCPGATCRAYPAFLLGVACPCSSPGFKTPLHAPRPP